MVEDSLSPETEAKIRLFHRLLISYNDFKHAGQVAGHILTNNLHERSRGESQLLLEALNCAMIVAYCRPFSGNDPGPARIPDLPGRFLGLLSQEEKAVHAIAMDDRNTVLAHSDAEAWNMRPQVYIIKGRKILVPMSHDTRVPLTREATETLGTMAAKLMEAVFEERRRLESELLDQFETIEFSNEDIEALRRKLPGSGEPTGGNE